MIQKTKKTLIIGLICISCVGGIYSFSKIGNMVLKSAIHDLAKDHFEPLISQGEITKSEGEQVIQLVSDISDVYVDSLGFFAKDPTPRLKEIYDSHKKFLLSMIDKDMPIEKRKKIINDIEHYKKYPTKEYLDLPKETQILIDQIFEDVEKEVALTI